MSKSKKLTFGEALVAAAPAGEKFSVVTCESRVFGVAAAVLFFDQVVAFATKGQGNDYDYDLKNGRVHVGDIASYEEACSKMDAFIAEQF